MPKRPKGEEEKKIRKDPVATGSAVLKQVFGGLDQAALGRLRRPPRGMSAQIIDPCVIFF